MTGANDSQTLAKLLSGAGFVAAEEETDDSATSSRGSGTSTPPFS